MKKLTITALNLTILTTLQAQTNTFPASGNAGVGITTPNFNFQVHGTTNYSETDRSGNGINYGVTSRLGFTNTSTGSTANDGLLMRMSQTNFVMDNKENGSISFLTGSSSITTSSASIRAYSNKIVFGQGSTDDNTAAVNILKAADNGLYIRTISSGYAGISIRSNALTDNAIQVMGTTGTTRNFAVKSNGEVYARKYTTTLTSIPDYVFEPNYSLMTLSNLRTYIQENKHLPNIPSAKEMEASEVDLGEMNRLLLEKTEELTLYILQLEERLKALEAIK